MSYYKLLKRVPSLIFTAAIPGILMLSGGVRQLKANEVKSDLNQVLDTIAGEVRESKLDNGLRLIMMKRDYAPVVSYYIKFLAGGSDETERTQGIAHMLEHMLFKGTPNIGTRDYEKEKKYITVINAWARRMDSWKKKADEARKSGDSKTLEKAEKMQGLWKKRIGRLTAEAREYIIIDEDSYLYSLHGQRGYNAYTSRDLTNYQIELPANRMEVWAKLESDRIQNSVLRDFYTERDVVAEERRMRVENVAQNALLEDFLRQAYGDHPYGKPLIGSMDSIRYMTFEDAQEFYRTYYSANNIVISIVGDIDFDRTEAMVNKYFGSMKSTVIPRNKITPPASPANLNVTLKKEGSPFQLLGWFKPSMPDPADLKLEILGRILAGGRDTRLFRKLVIEKRLASSISVYSSYPGERYTNLFMFLAVPAPGKNYDDVQTAILEELENIKKNGVTEDELNRVKKSLAVEMIYSLRSNSDIADRLSYYATVTGDYHVMFDVYKELETITINDVKEAAKTYLAEDRMMTARLLPPEEK